MPWLPACNNITSIELVFIRLKATSEKLKAAQWLHQQGKYDEAKHAYLQLLAEDPDSVEILVSVAILENDLGHHRQACRIIGEAVALNPKEPLLYVYCGDFYFSSNAFSEAIGEYQKAIHLSPGTVDFHQKVAKTHEKARQPEQAYQSYKRILSLDPENETAILKVAEHVIRDFRYNEAIELLKKHLQKKPSAYAVLHLLCSVLISKGDLEEARQVLNIAKEKDPDSVELTINSAREKMLMNQHSQVIELLEEALITHPEHVATHINLGASYLAQARFDKGWPNFEWRWRSNDYHDPCIRYPQPKWEGQNLKKKTLLVHAEQGFGDTLQFVRYLKKLKSSHLSIHAQAPGSLLSLLQTQSYIDRVYQEKDTPSDFDYHISILSLPYVMKESSTLAELCPYLQIENNPKKDQKQDFQLGISWAGAQNNPLEKSRWTRRSLNFKHFEKILSLDHIQIHSFQKDLSEEDQLYMKAFPNLIDRSPELIDFHATASILMQMDLLITNDSAIAHVAGALGINTWVILPFSPSWRWHAKDGVSTWYPSLQLFQPSQDKGHENILNDLSLKLERCSF